MRVENIIQLVLDVGSSIDETEKNAIFIGNTIILYSYRSVLLYDLSQIGSAFVMTNERKEEKIGEINDGYEINFITWI